MGFILRADPSKSHSLKSRSWGCSLVTEHLPGMHETWGLVPTMEKRNSNRQKSDSSAESRADHPPPICFKSNPDSY